VLFNTHSEMLKVIQVQKRLSVAVVQNLESDLEKYFQKREEFSKLLKKRMKWPVNLKNHLNHAYINNKRKMLFNNHSRT